MNKKIYKYLSALTLLWACSSCHMHAANTKYSNDPKQVSNYFYSHEPGDEHEMVEKMKKGLDDIINPQDKAQKVSQYLKQKKNAVLVLGIPDTYLPEVDDNEVKKYDGNLFLQLGKFIVTPKPYLQEVTEENINRIRDFLIEKWRKKQCLENMFMQKTFCNDKYTQHYVGEHSYLPQIYCPNAKEDNNKTVIEQEERKEETEQTDTSQQRKKELPIYIVVPSLYDLLQGIFFENYSDCDMDMPKSKDKKEKYRLRLEVCIKIFNQYMAQIYRLVNIKALVINHDCMDMSFSSAQGEAYKLERIDILIRSFGSFLYKKEENEKEKGGKYTINPQVFWLNWWKSSQFSHTGYGELNKDTLFRTKIEAAWFQPTYTLLCFFRHVSLLYPFVKAHRPEDLGSHKEKYTKRDKMLEGMPVASLAQKDIKQMATLHIDKIIPFAGKAKESAELQKWEEISAQIIDAANRNETIPADRFRFEVAIRYHYASLYHHQVQNCWTSPGIRKFLCRQGDTPIKGVMVSKIQLYISEYQQYNSKEQYDQQYELYFLNELNKMYGDGISKEPYIKSIAHHGAYGDKEQPGDMSIANHEDYGGKEQPQNMEDMSIANHEAYGDKVEWKKNLEKVGSISILCGLVLFAVYYYIYEQKKRGGRIHEEEEKIKELKEVNQKLKEGNQNLKEVNQKLKEANQKLREEIKERSIRSENFFSRLQEHFFFFVLLLILSSILIGLYFRRKRKK